MPKFNKGDRVRIISPAYPVTFGTLGTVLENHQMPDVEWDNWHKGHSGPFNDGRETVLAAFEEDLELVPPEEAQPVEPVSPDPGAPEETLRDRMAMAALTGCPTRIHIHGAEPIARWCYEVADAMLKEREGK